MTAVPSKIRALDKTGFQACHLAPVVVRSICGTPGAIIPLADEAAPVLDRQLLLLAADLEYRLLVAVG